jgi:hypothetical protein
VPRPGELTPAQPAWINSSLLFRGSGNILDALNLFNGPRIRQLIAGIESIMGEPWQHPSQSGARFVDKKVPQVLAFRSTP